MVRSRVSVRGIVLGLAVAVLGTGKNAPADLFNMGPDLTSLDFVTVGDPGNAPDVDFGNGAGARGAVPYTYQLGKFDVTAAQYTEFLNAVAATDTYSLWSTRMAPGGLWPAQGNWLNWQGNPPAQWPEIDYMSIFNGDTVTIRVGEAPVGDGCVDVLGELAAKPRGGRG
jgi:formylglycine-generating enzyme required for sulfatase activity